MIPTRHPRHLRLQRQTLRTLSITELADVAGGRPRTLAARCEGSKDGNEACTTRPSEDHC